MNGTTMVKLNSKESSVTRKKSQNVYKSCPKMISLEKLKVLSHLQKLSKNVADSGNLIVVEGFKNLPKVPYIVTSGHSEGKSHLRWEKWASYSVTRCWNKK